MHDWIRMAPLVCVVAMVTPAAAGEDNPNPALICLVEGQVHIALAGSDETRPARLLDRVPPGFELRVGEISRAVLVLLDGRRFELQAGATATIGPTGLGDVQGKVTRLEDVPVIAEIVGVDPSERIGVDTAATRVRSSEDELAEEMGLDPATGGVVRADHTLLRWRPVDGVSRYQVEIDGPDGDRSLMVKTCITEVAVPAGVLDPGVEYHWSVRALGDTRYRRGAGAVFSTLDAQLAQRRGEVADAATAANDADMYVLLGAVDASVGLHREACDDLRAAADLGGGADAIRQAHEAMGCRIDRDAS